VEALLARAGRTSWGVCGAQEEFGQRLKEGLIVPRKATSRKVMEEYWQL
jgi:hypothetical protein